MSEAEIDLVRRRLDADPDTNRWNDLRWVARTGSTNADLVELARSGATAPVVLVADHQTSGRGRLDRRWESPPGANLLVSVLLRPEGQPDRWGWVSAAVAVAAVDACHQLGVDVAVKWPNDLHHDGAKVAGLLAEAVTTPSALVVGLGVNVAWPAAADPELGATSLRALGAAGDRFDLLGELLPALDRRIDELARDQAGLVAAYRSRCSTLGERVRVDLVGGGEITGKAITVDDRGALLVDTGGTTEVVTVGDVHHLRPA
ncbi:MAG: biotin--[acetyl-CoA-carboxylase] ligase [Acidimicrobiales bacterium]